MIKFTIYHPASGKMNHNCDSSIPYSYVGQVDAENLEDAFRKAQNDFNMQYRGWGVRSTSVGDLIQSDVRGSFYMVAGMGFNQVNSPILSAATSPAQ